ncbi:MAG: transcription-repair coupling factor [Planctomycetota bacterium]
MPGPDIGAFLEDLVHIVERTAPVRALGDALREGRRVVATGNIGPSVSFAALGVARRTGRTVVIACAHADEAEDIAAESDALEVGSAVIIPALELSPGETGVSAELFAERAAVLRALRDDSARRVLVAPVASLMQPAPSKDRLDSLVRSLRRGDAPGLTGLADWLVAAGYDRVETVEEPGQFAVRGGIIDVFSPVAGAGTQPVPVRLDFFGDEIDSIREFDLGTMGSDRAIDVCTLAAAGGEALSESRDDISVLDYIPDGALAIVAETFEVVEQARGYFERVSDGRTIYGPPAVLKKLAEVSHGLAELNQFSSSAAEADVRIDLPASPLPAFDRDAASAVGELSELAQAGRVILACGSEAESARICELISLHAPDADIERRVLDIRRGMIIDGQENGERQVAIVPSGQLLHRSSVRRRVAKLRAGRAMDTFLEIAEDDFVVHADHGIAKFVGLSVLPAGGTKTRKKSGRPAQTLRPTAQPKQEDHPTEEYLTLEFAGKSRLHVPCSQIDLVQKYVGGFRGKPQLSTIGGRKWKGQKERVADSVRDLAGELLRVRAAREHQPGIAYPSDTSWQTEFEAEFPYEETEDQLAALIEIKKDMTRNRPMDRLICGDVGFGKTELAIRAAFKACEFGRQVAVLVPTTVLAEQHERTFRARFADYPFRVESLSRFKTVKQINETLRDVRKGAVDVIVGTHRLLSRDVKFADLGLVVIDEEQRFGVEHKEALLQLRMTVDVMTLSATPIPRTLHMSMLGLRDISSLTTAPVDRRSVVTEVIPYNEKRVSAAIRRELAREGQVFYVHNRVHDILSAAARVQALAPDARIVVGHGQMEPSELEQVMLQFMRREADVLVSTTIIEAGIDIPTANTMIIDDADRFGLAELHQLRGRVGRSHHRAYCYLLLPADRSVKEVAQKRLRAIEEYSMLGAGFKIAMRDLEIRGAGNLLGAEQSGHIAAVGYEMFCRLLDHAVHQLTNSTDEEMVKHTTVDIGLHGMLPRPYIPSDQRRLEAYRRLASAGSPEEVDQVRADLVSAYGEPPASTRRLILLARLRAAAQRWGIRAVSLRGQDIVLMIQNAEPVAASLDRAGVGTVRIVNPDLAQTNATADGRPLTEIYVRVAAGRPGDPIGLAKSMIAALAREMPQAPRRLASVRPTG